MVRLGQEGLTAVRAVRTLIFYIIAYTVERSIMYMIMNKTSYDHEHDHEGHVEPKPLIFKVRPVL